jgi:hypothetical protein
MLDRKQLVRGKLVFVNIPWQWQERELTVANPWKARGKFLAVETERTLPGDFPAVARKLQRINHQTDADNVLGYPVEIRRIVVG